MPPHASDSPYPPQPVPLPAQTAPPPRQNRARATITHPPPLLPKFLLKYCILVVKYACVAAILYCCHLTIRRTLITAVQPARCGTPGTTQCTPHWSTLSDLALPALTTCTDHEYACSWFLLLAALIITYALYIATSPRPCYLMDYTLWKGEDALQAPHALLVSCHKELQGVVFTKDSVDFVARVLAKSAISDTAYVPDFFHSVPDKMSRYTAGDTAALRPTISDGRDEFAAVSRQIVPEVLQKCGLTPADVSVLVVNSSLFCPTPSHAAWVMREWGFPPTTLSYNLGGMGCSAMLVGVECAKNALMTCVPRGGYALVLSVECSSTVGYQGNEKSFLLPNTLFRAGGSAKILSNRRIDAWRAKYRLEGIVRTVYTRNNAFDAVNYREDAAGIPGLYLSPDVPAAASAALLNNLSRLGRRFLPAHEQLLFVLSTAARALKLTRQPLYNPDFRSCFSHVCIHSGGRAVVDGLAAQLQLTDAQVEASRASLWRFGNVSSPAVWYVLGYAESFKRVKRGQRVLQVCLGSGFKVNTGVWVAMREGGGGVAGVGGVGPGGGAGKNV